LDFSQATQLLAWLDEEHRKDKVLLATLQSQIDAQKTQLTEHTRQLQEIQAALTRVEGQSARLSQMEVSLQAMRTEFVGLLAKQAADQETRQEQRARTDKLEGETMARLIRQLQERVEGLGSFDSGMALLRDEDSRLQTEVAMALAQLAEMVKTQKVQDQHVELLTSEGRSLREGLEDLRLLHEDVREQGITLRATVEAVGTRLDARVEQLQSSIAEASKGRQGELAHVQNKVQGQAQRLDDLARELGVVQALINRWSKQMEEMMAHYEHNRKTLYDLHELERQVRQQGKELAELQRLAVERQRAELREWQDGQANVDEGLTARIEQLEDSQRKASETLQGLESNLEQSHRDMLASTDQLWQVWSEFAREQTKAYGAFKQRRAS
jgi:chromosome segregation ATPase